MLENRAENPPPSFEEANINNNCYVHLTSAGVRQYERYHAQFAWAGVTPRDIDMTSDGGIFQIHELMHLFGSVFVDDLKESPFRHNQVTLDLDDGFSLGNEPSRGKRTISVNDFILVELTENAQEIVKKRFPIPIFNTIGPLTEMQFHTAAHLFGDDMYNGSNKLPFKRNAIYIPNAFVHLFE
jgi:hypothetical protein